MKQHLNIIAGLLIVLLTFGCSKDDISEPTSNNSVTQEDTDTPKSEYKLKKIETIQNGVPINTTEYEYNSLGNITKLKVVKTDKTIETTFNYDQNDVMVTWNQKETDNFDEEYKITQVNNLEYSNGKITTICIDRNTFDYWGDESLSKDKIVYTYGADSNPISIKHYEETMHNSFFQTTCSDVKYISNEEKFEHVDGNTVKYSSGVPSFFSESYNLIEYDAKINPYSTIKPAVFRNIITGRSTKNNIAKVYVHDVSDDSLQGTSVFENTYNNANYLTKAIEKHYKPDQTVPVQITTINYYYY